MPNKPFVPAHFFIVLLLLTLLLYTGCAPRQAPPQPTPAFATPPPAGTAQSATGENEPQANSPAGEAAPAGASSLLYDTRYYVNGDPGLGFLMFYETGAVLISTFDAGEAEGSYARIDGDLHCMFPASMYIDFIVTIADPLVMEDGTPLIPAHAPGYIGDLTSLIALNVNYYHEADKAGAFICLQADSTCTLFDPDISSYKPGAYTVAGSYITATTDDNWQLRFQIVDAYTLLADGGGLFIRE